MSQLAPPPRLPPPPPPSCARILSRQLPHYPRRAPVNKQRRPEHEVHRQPRRKHPLTLLTCLGHVDDLLQPARKHPRQHADRDPVLQSAFPSRVGWLTRGFTQAGAPSGVSIEACGLTCRAEPWAGSRILSSRVRRVAARECGLRVIMCVRQSTCDHHEGREHTFRLFKQVLGWTAPKIRSPHAADRWTWLIIAAHTQLRLARDLTADLRRPWERPAPPGRLTPPGSAADSGTSGRKPPARPGRQKPGKPGPGRPPGSKNRRPAPCYDVGKTAKRELTLKASRDPDRLNDKLSGPEGRDRRRSHWSRAERARTSNCSCEPMTRATPVSRDLICLLIRLRHCFCCYAQRCYSR